MFLIITIEKQPFFVLMVTTSGNQNCNANIFWLRNIRVIELLKNVTSFTLVQE